MNLEPKRSHYSRWEYVLPVLACVSLIVSCLILSPKKLYWNDELFSYYFVSDPSFSSMLASFHDKLNNTPVLYFALGWVWDKVFGSTEISLRLFSSLGMCAALLVTWSALRRTYGFWATTLGTLTVFTTSLVILAQNTEARMYGLFLALSAVAFLLYDQCCRTRHPSTKLLWINAAVHVGILHTHLFGGFYSGAILVALFLTDRYFHRFRPRVYLSIILSWLSIILYVPSFLNQSDAGKPRTWIPTPELTDLVNGLNISASPFFKLPTLLLLLVLLGLYRYRNKANRSGQPLKEAELVSASDISHLVFAGIFLALPVFIWLFSVTIKPIFYDRYMIPTALGWAILFTYFFHRLLPASGPSFKNKPGLSDKGRWATYLGAVSVFGALVIFLLNPVRYAYQFRETGTIEDYVDLKGHDDLPIVIQPGGAFIQNLYYASDPDKYYFVLDWEAAVNEHSGLFTPQEFKHMEAWKRRYPQVFKNVVTTEGFLGKHDRFLVLDFPDYTRKCPLNPKGLKHALTWEDLQCPQWVEMRLLHNMGYKVTFLDDANWFAVLLVKKQQNSPDITASAH